MKVFLLILFLIPIIIFQGILFLDIVRNINKSNKKHSRREVHKLREIRSEREIYQNNTSFRAVK